MRDFIMASIMIVTCILIVIRVILLIVSYKRDKRLYINKWKEEAVQQIKDQLRDIERQISEKKQFNEQLLRIREDELDRLMKKKKEMALTIAQKEINDWTRSAQEAAAFNVREYTAGRREECREEDLKLQELKKEVEEYQKKRNTINEDIMRARMVEEMEDFYRVQISDASLHDLALIEEIRNQFSKVDLLDKLVYDNYIKKPVEEMVKRVLSGRAPSGIYKITRMKTGEVYIGKSTDVKARWIQHAKSCYHCGTISQSILHTTMQKDGIENFTWELLEEVPKEKLSEREKYWIQFYDSKKYGLNEKEG